MDIEDHIAIIEESFNGEPWFGTSVYNSLKGIPIEFWNEKPMRIAHSIAELVVHMIDWRGFVIEKIQGNEGFSIEMNSEQDWRKGVFINSENDKQLILHELMKTQEQLCELLRSKPDSWLLELVAGGAYRNDYMIKGLVPHDIYHLGQVNLIKSILINQ